MKQLHKTTFLLLFALISNSCFSQDKLPTMVGSDIYLSNYCKDSCVIDYEKYRVVTKTHSNALGEEIVVFYKINNLRVTIDVKDEYCAQYFYGLYGDKIIIDAGTGTIRSNFIYDLGKQRIVDSIDNILDDSRIVNGKLYYMSPMSDERARVLKLTSCEKSDVENNGYSEEFRYDFNTHKITSTGKYICIK